MQCSCMVFDYLSLLVRKFHANQIIIITNFIIEMRAAKKKASCTFLFLTRCKVAGAAYSPTTDFRQISATGTIPIVIEATGARGQLVNGKDTVYCECKVGICLLESDVNCQQVGISNVV